MKRAQSLFFLSTQVSYVGADRQALLQKEPETLMTCQTHDELEYKTPISASSDWHYASPPPCRPSLLYMPTEDASFCSLPERILMPDP